jgi:hypothetical protein
MTASVDLVLSARESPLLGQPSASLWLRVALTAGFLSWAAFPRRREISGARTTDLAPRSVDTPFLNRRPST